MDFLVWLVNLSFFTLCRFYVFPQQLYLFFEKTNWETNYLLIVGAICMLTFNILILLDCLKSTFVRLSIALKNGEKHSFSESCRCGKCKSLIRSTSDTKSSSSESIAFTRFFKEFQIISPQETGAIGSMGAAKLAWKVLDKTAKAKYIDDVEAERGRSGMTRSWVEKQKEAWMDFLVWLVNLSFFTLCRFYVFPQQLYLFFEKTNWETNYLLIVGAICMLMFNILILLDCLKSTFVRLSIALKNGEKHSFSESCRCGKCKSLIRSTSDTKSSSSESIAFTRFFKEFQIISPQETGAIGSMGAAKLAWKVLDKTA